MFTCIIMHILFVLRIHVLFGCTKFCFDCLVIMHYGVKLEHFVYAYFFGQHVRHRNDLLNSSDILIPSVV